MAYYFNLHRAVCNVHSGHHDNKMHAEENDEVKFTNRKRLIIHLHNIYIHSILLKVCLFKSWESNHFKNGINIQAF